MGQWQTEGTDFVTGFFGNAYWNDFQIYRSVFAVSCVRVAFAKDWLSMNPKA